MSATNEARWTEIARNYYRTRYADTDESQVWSDLLDEAWDRIMSNVREVHPAAEGPCEGYRVKLEWSGPMFNTMDGGDYHWGTDHWESDCSISIMEYTICQLRAYRAEGFQSATATITICSTGHTATVDMNDIEGLNR